MLEMPPDLDFIHRYVPAQDTSSEAHSSTLLLLHGTGGDENALLQLGSQLNPKANLLSPRGKVLEQGAPRFFRRFAEGVLDEVDVRARSQELADFVIAAAQHYGFDSGRVTAVGYSNGANIALGLMMLRPEVLAGAILFRAMPPLSDPPLPDLSKRRVFLSEGEHDPIVSKAQATQLANYLKRTQAEVEVRWWPIGHGLLEGEFIAARAWLTR